MDLKFLIESLTTTESDALASSNTATNKNQHYGPALTIRKSPKASSSESGRKFMTETRYSNVNSITGEHATPVQDVTKRETNQRRARNKTKSEGNKRLNRRSEKARQMPLHSISVPRVHSCKLAPVSELNLEGVPRHSHHKNCGLCGSSLSASYGSRRGALACDACDWDICRECYHAECSSPEEKKEYAAHCARIEAERNRVVAESRRRFQDDLNRHREAQRLLSVRIRAAYEPKQFTTNIKEPSEIARNKRELSCFTVWKSYGHPPDERYSYLGEEMKKFDTSWPSKEEANLRARYLFFFQNVWNVKPNKLGADIEMKEQNGLSHLGVQKDASEYWSVGVAASDTYRYWDDTNLYMKDEQVDDVQLSDTIERNTANVQASYDVKQYTEDVREPSIAARNKIHVRGFPVWKSLGYQADGFHSSEGEEKEFDSSWTTKSEANLRARFLFFFRNEWGLTPDEFGANAVMNEIDGFVRLKVTMEDSERWTVGVVPSNMFHLLDKEDSSD